MKTAMQELIEYLEKVYYVKEIIDWDKYKKDLLEKEKEQIMFAYNDGVNDGNTQGLLGKEGNGNYVTLEEYYNQNYNQNK